MGIVSGDSVTVEYTGRLDDGTVFETTRKPVAEKTGLADDQPDREFGALTVEVGNGQIIEGLENGLIGLEEGDSSTITVPPEGGFGEWTEDNIREFDAEELQETVGDSTIREGGYLKPQRGQRGQITHIDDETVRVDFNPDLAGETLEFEVEIVDITQV